MRHERNRPNIEKLFVFGSGASFCATSGNGVDRRAPLDAEFCGRLADLSAQKPAWVADAKERVLAAWKDHEEFRHIGLEKAIIRHLGHAEFRRAIHKRARQGVLAPAEYLNLMAHLICFVLRRAKESKAAPYAAVVNEYFKDAGTPNRAITFNYDELFDHHLLARASLQEVYFDRMNLGSIGTGKRPAKYPDPLLIKLHGSANWRCTEADFTEIVSGAQSNGGEEWPIDRIWYADKGTPSPDEDSSPLIIPPLPNKPITRIKLFCFLWTRAYEYLHQAEEIVICGYSLPDTDSMAQTLFANFRNPKVQQISVVDPSPEILKKWRNLLRRRGINPKATWRYYETFQEYVASVL